MSRLNPTIRELVAEANLEKLRGTSLQTFVKDKTLLRFEPNDVYKINKSLETITNILNKYEHLRNGAERK
jgi:hypothetical protein